MLELNTTIGVRMNKEDAVKLKTIAKDKRLPMATMVRSVITKHIINEHEK